MKKYKNRQEVPDKYKWDLTEFFASEKEFEKSFKDCQEKIESLKKYVGCTKNAFKLYEYLEEETKTISLWESLYGYASLINDEKLGVSKNLERKNKTENLYASLETVLSFFAPELLKLNKEDYKKLFKDNKKLLEYKFALDIIYREKDHILSESEEKIVAELTTSMNNFAETSATLLNREHNYGKIKLEDGTIEEIATNNFRSLMRNKNRTIRKKVYKSFNKVLDQYGTTSANLLNAFVNMNNSVAKIRKYESSWQEKLYSINMLAGVFETLVNAVENNLEGLQKYIKLKKRALKLDKIYKYDLNLDMASNNREYSIEEAQEIVRKSLTPLGKEYLEKYDKIITNRYIDYCQYKGKFNGGYALITATKDPRILMNFTGDMESISTIAHESGHNVQQQFINENNPLQYREISLLVAEVASLTNECLLSKYILDNSTDNQEKKIGLENIIDVIVSNLYGAVREGKIEEEMYEEVLNGGMITQEYMDNKTLESLKKYYGNAVVIDENAKNSWITRTHYYMHFYLYNYAICISAAINVADRILAGDQEMLANYKKFLSLGADVWPLDAFKVLGVNLEDEKTYENAIKYFEKLIDKYNKILDVEEKSNE